MKKTLLSTVVLLLAVSAASAQDVFRKNDLVFNVGIGVNNALYHGANYKTTVPPLSVSGEYGVADNMIQGRNGSISVGGYLGYTGSKYHYPGHDYGWKYNSIIIGARGSFHYQFARNLDTYAGLMLGYNIVSSKESGNWDSTNYSASDSEFSFSVFAGARYWFGRNVGVFAEVGYGISNVTLGVTFRM